MPAAAAAAAATSSMIQNRHCIPNPIESNRIGIGIGIEKHIQTKHIHTEGNKSLGEYREEIEINM